MAGGQTLDETLAHAITVAPAHLYTPTEAEQVVSLSVQVGPTIGSDVEVGVYDVTGLADPAGSASGAVKVVSGNVPIDDASSVNTLVLAEPAALTAGNDYAIGFRLTGSTALLRFAASGATRRSTLTGSSALASSWTDNGSFTSKWAVFATTEAGAPSGPPRS